MLLLFRRRERCPPVAVLGRSILANRWFNVSLLLLFEVALLGRLDSFVESDELYLLGMVELFVLVVLVLLPVVVFLRFVRVLFLRWEAPDAGEVAVDLGEDVDLFVSTSLLVDDNPCLLLLLFDLDDIRVGCFMALPPALVFLWLFFLNDDPFPLRPPFSVPPTTGSQASPANPHRFKTASTSGCSAPIPFLGLRRMAHPIISTRFFLGDL